MFSWFVPEVFVFGRAHQGLTGGFYFAPAFGDIVAAESSSLIKDLTFDS